MGPPFPDILMIALPDKQESGSLPWMHIYGLAGVERKEKKLTNRRNGTVTLEVFREKKNIGLYVTESCGIRNWRTAGICDRDWVGNQWSVYLCYFFRLQRLHRELAFEIVCGNNSKFSSIMAAHTHTNDTCCEVFLTAATACHCMVVCGR